MGILSVICQKLAKYVVIVINIIAYYLKAHKARQKFLNVGGPMAGGARGWGGCSSLMSFPSTQIRL